MDTFGATGEEGDMEPPYRRRNELEARFQSPPSIEGEVSSTVPAVPPNSRLRARRGYVPDPVEEAVPPPEFEPSAVYLRDRSIRQGEVQIPIDEVSVTHRSTPDHGLPSALGAEKLQAWEEKFVTREGTRFKRQVRFWSFLMLVAFSGLFVTSFYHSMVNVGSGPIVIGASYSSLMFTAAMMCVVRIWSIIRQYGFRPVWRVIVTEWCYRVTKNRDVVRWYESDGQPEYVRASNGKARGA